MTRLLLTIIALMLGLLIFVVDTEESKIYDLENEVQQYKQLNYTNSELLDEQKVRIDELMGANEALIEYSVPKSCIKAINHTPLPKLVKEKL